VGRSGTLPVGLWLAFFASIHEEVQGLNQVLVFGVMRFLPVNELFELRELILDLGLQRLLHESHLEAHFLASDLLMLELLLDSNLLLP